MYKYAILILCTKARIQTGSDPIGKFKLIECTQLNYRKYTGLGPLLPSNKIMPQVHLAPIGEKILDPQMSSMNYQDSGYTNFTSYYHRHLTLFIFLVMKKKYTPLMYMQVNICKQKNAFFGDSCGYDGSDIAQKI